MKIVCSVSVGNRTLPALSISAKQKHVRSTLALCKNPKSQNFSIILFTNQNKTGTQYGIENNIIKILTRFVNEGKTTIQFKVPPHDLYIQCDVIQLKGFLHLLKRVLENKISPKELTCSTASVTAASTKDFAPKKLVIKARSEYPSKGFPRTLESLYINSINRCSLDRGILNLTKLKILDLSCNCIENLPAELSQLNLSELNLSTNCFEKSHPGQWSWMGNNLGKSLVKLNLESNKLRYLTEQIVKLRNLENLIVNNNELTLLPQCLGSLRNLKSLMLSNNHLTVLPGSLRYRKLDFLDVHSNNFVSPDGIAHTSCENLPILSLKEFAAKNVLALKLEYNSAVIPRTLVKYLDCAKYCTCGKPCLDIFIQCTEMIELNDIGAQNVSYGESCVPIKCCYCSVKCFHKTHRIRLRRLRFALF